MLILCHLLVFLQVLGGSWLEIPSGPEPKKGQTQVSHFAKLEGKEQRNYTLFYDSSLYTALWVAYPLHPCHLSEGREENWAYDPKIRRCDQTSVQRGYSTLRFPTTNYKSNYYARGHQIPNADRNGVAQMQSQTYYSPNLTPQLQNGFNGAIWKNLEEALRNCAQAQHDTLYIVTGALFQREDLDEKMPIRYVTNRNDGKKLPIPNYYWKAALKVKRAEDGTIIDACGVGFFLPHCDLKGHKYREYLVSIDCLENYTGLDLFPHLDDTIEKACESQASWDKFKNY